MIYRGQAYGAPVGEWWTSSLEEADKFAMSRGGNRTYVVLGLDEDDEQWLRDHCTFPNAGSHRGDWYHIPLADLRARWSGVRIVSGAISLEPGRAPEATS